MEEKMPNRLDGKVVLITGAARGIGEAHARLFAAEGADVVLADVRRDLGAPLAKDIEVQGGRAIYVDLDVTRSEQWESAVKTAVSRYGKLTSLVNNAAIYSDKGLECTPPDLWSKILHTNLDGQWLGMRAAMPELLKNKGAAIVNVCSLFGNIGVPGSTAYQASKGGVRLLTKSVAMEYAKRGVRVNSVHPGSINTDFATGVVTDEKLNEMRTQIPMGRPGESIEVAYGSLYLCSDEASYLTGTELIIDGGWSVP
jgi:NAD(P)-dependent dehydrogenase (short-subunit alcohol dehydrogenase family)